VLGSPIDDHLGSGWWPLLKNLNKDKHPSRLQDDNASGTSALMGNSRKSSMANRGRGVKKKCFLIWFAFGAERARAIRGSKYFAE